MLHPVVKDAVNPFKKTLSVIQASGNLLSTSIALINMGDSHKKLKHHKKAEDCYNRAIKIARKLKVKYYLCGYIFSKADLYYILKKYDKAVELSREAQAIAKEIKDSSTIFDCEVLQNRIKYEMAKRILQYAKR